MTSEQHYQDLERTSSQYTTHHLKIFKFTKTNSVVMVLRPTIPLPPLLSMESPQSKVLITEHNSNVPWQRSFLNFPPKLDHLIFIFHSNHSNGMTHIIHFMESVKNSAFQKPPLQPILESHFHLNF